MAQALEDKEPQTEPHSPQIINGNQVVLVNRSHPSSRIGSGRKIETNHTNSNVNLEVSNCKDHSSRQSRERIGSMERFKDNDNRAISPIHENNQDTRIFSAPEANSQNNSIRVNQQHASASQFQNSGVHGQQAQGVNFNHILSPAEQRNFQFNQIMVESSNQTNKNENETIVSSEMPAHLLKSMPLGSNGPYIVTSIDTDQ